MKSQPPGLNLSLTLKRPEMEPAILVLVISTTEELEEFLQLMPVLEKSKIYLVLLNPTEETMARAEQLNPEFISRPEEDLIEVGTLIDKYLREQRVSPTAEDTLPPKNNL
jgi:hypothetical protein